MPPPLLFGGRTAVAPLALLLGTRTELAGLCLTVAGAARGAGGVGTPPAFEIGFSAGFKTQLPGDGAMLGWGIGSRGWERTFA